MMKFPEKLFLLFALFCYFSANLASNDGATSSTPPTPTTDKWEDRRAFIRNLTIEAWSAYSGHSWGKRMHRLVDRNPEYFYFAKDNVGHTLLDSLTTLLIMNLTSELQRAEQWLTTEMNFTQIVKPPEPTRWPGLEIVESPPLGALLSMYTLTGKAVYREKAALFASSIEPISM